MRHKLIVLGTVAAACVAQAQDQWWCGGDGARRTGLACERNTFVTDARTYDDFDVPVPAVARGAWGNFLIRGFMPSRAYYEIRSDVSEGNGGTLHASGEMVVQVSSTGRVAQGFPEYLVRGEFPQAVELAVGRYWLTLAPIGNGSGECFVSDTDGLDELPESDPTPPPMGTPQNNHNSFFDSPFFNCNFCDTRRQLGQGVWDFAFGVGPNTGPPVQIRPETFQVTYGELIQGQLSDLFEFDGNRLVIQQRLSPRISAPNAQLVVESRLPFDTVGYLSFGFVACSTGWPRDNLIRRVELFDYRSGTWSTVDEAPSGKNDCKRETRTIALDASRFVEPSTGNVRAALSWLDRGSATLNWSALIDHTRWIVEPE